jgi:hypothetical protein
MVRGVPSRHFGGFGAGATQEIEEKAARRFMTIRTPQILSSFFKEYTYISTLNSGAPVEYYSTTTTPVASVVDIILLGLRFMLLYFVLQYLIVATGALTRRYSEYSTVEPW